MWYTKSGKDGDIVLSSRVRLARNLKDIPFGNRMTKEQENFVAEKCKKALKDLKYIELGGMPEAEKTSLLEQHIISPDMLGEERKKAILINSDSTVSVMLGEEDHIRIQCMAPGFDLEGCRREADKIDDMLESEIEYGFSDRFGYLTCCPTNVGTGMRASVMVHLPALVISEKINGLMNALSKLGFAVRGIYGEGSRAFGNIFQISNQVTLGASEEEIIQKMNQAVSEICEKEREAAKKLYEQNKYKTEDRVMRSLGTLKNAVIMSSKEAMSLISDLRLGVNLGIIKDLSGERINEVMYAVLPATLTKNHNIMSASERDIKRAEVIKQML